MNFVPYGFLGRGKPVEGYFKKHKTHFTKKIPKFSVYSGMLSAKENELQ